MNRENIYPLIIILMVVCSFIFAGLFLIGGFSVFYVLMSLSILTSFFLAAILGTLMKMVRSIN